MPVISLIVWLRIRVYRSDIILFYLAIDAVFSKTGGGRGPCVQRVTSGGYRKGVGIDRKSGCVRFISFHLPLSLAGPAANQLRV